MERQYRRIRNIPTAESRAGLQFLQCVQNRTVQPSSNSGGLPSTAPLKTTKNCYQNTNRPRKRDKESEKRTKDARITTVCLCFSRPTLKQSNRTEQKRRKRHEKGEEKFNLLTQETCRPVPKVSASHKPRCSYSLKMERPSCSQKE